jgi:uncharacterized membrane protein YkvA (DUF1232 family)
MGGRQSYGFPGAERFISGAFGANRASVVAGFWRALRRAAARVPFAPELAAAYYCALDPRTPFRVRATLLAALAYFVLPSDAVPDLLPLLGLTDDIAVLTTVLGMTAAHVSDEHRAKARETLEGWRDA